MNWLEALPKNRSRGSSPRCLMLMDGNDKEVSERLTRIVNISGVHITKDHFWMPIGKPIQLFNNKWNKRPTREAQLGKSSGFLTSEQQEEVNNWWLDVRKMATTPNWDIASTCIINEEEGLLLIEAKAHDTELNNESKGKRLGKEPNKNTIKNHKKIGCAIKKACNSLKQLNIDWNISRDSHYQLSNRFAWAWKISELGIPVVLIYLGFLNANEMEDKGNPFKSANDWKECVLQHSSSVVPKDTWETWQKTENSKGFLPLIRSITMDISII